MRDLLDAKPNEIGLGAILGIMLVILSVVFISLDLFGVTRQVEPPPFLGDYVPLEQQVCDGLDVRAVQQSNELFHSLDWPWWPAPASHDCTPVHRPADPGVVRWHSCQSLRDVGGVVSPPCPPDNVRGATYAQTNGVGDVIAVDIYLWPAPATSCRWPHEEAHARGFLVLPKDDDETKYVKGAHTEKPGHLLGEQCGFGLKWLDRSIIGDWPYKEAR